LEISQIPANTPDWKKKQMADKREQQRKIEQERDLKKYKEMDAKRAIVMKKEEAEALKDADAARASLKGGNFEEAIHYFELALAKYPKHADYKATTDAVEKELSEVKAVCFILFLFYFELICLFCSVLFMFVFQPISEFFITWIISLPFPFVFIS
jgi:tetratricopeptide (TPR) repeat protein